MNCLNTLQEQLKICIEEVKVHRDQCLNIENDLDDNGSELIEIRSQASQSNESHEEGEDNGPMQTDWIIDSDEEAHSQQLQYLDNFEQVKIFR